MLYKFAIAVALAASSAAAQNNKGGQNNNNNKGGNAAANTGNNNANNNAADGLTLLANAVQKGSAQDGSANIAAGQALSITSDNNFINFCSGKTLTNGLQVQGGSCNGVVMGDIPSKANMVSSIITFPTQGGNDVQADTTFDIKVQMANFVAGTFTNADTTYYSAPQQLQGGKVVGHTHVTVQDLGNTLNPTTPLDATQFAFFKGINDAGDGKGGLSATVTGGLPAGNYRVCTMASSSNHQLVLMPVAQRGASDDCTKFTVGAGNNNGGNNNNNNAAAANNNNNNAAATAAAANNNNNNNNNNNAATATAAANNNNNNNNNAAATAAAANNNNNNNNNNNAATATAAANNNNNNKNGQQAQQNGQQAQQNGQQAQQNGQQAQQNGQQGGQGGQGRRGGRRVNRRTFVA
ncbi:hypothetical protein VE02_07176 [Pseudogymnoascus sp. 03VT05]|nr:hypothetical protein VE02_07176 [Pseudogymnoascus sp. 03VT05]